MNVETNGQALRDVKEYASQSSDLNIDSLQLKLMHLDEVARRYDLNLKIPEATWSPAQHLRRDV